jgi:hypothetical protein
MDRKRKKVLVFSLCLAILTFVILWLTIPCFDKTSCRCFYRSCVIIEPPTSGPTDSDNQLFIKQSDSIPLVKEVSILQLESSYTFFNSTTNLLQELPMLKTLYEFSKNIISSTPTNYTAIFTFQPIPENDPTSALNIQDPESLSTQTPESTNSIQDLVQNSTFFKLQFMVCQFSYLGNLQNCSYPDYIDE